MPTKQELIRGFLEKATPGPWSLAKWDDPSCASVVGILSERHQNVEKEERIAALWCNCDSGCVVKQENAELLTAAPDLARIALAALEAIDEIRKTLPPFAPSNRAGATVDFEVERILKAKGLL